MFLKECVEQVFMTPKVNKIAIPNPWNSSESSVRFCSILSELCHIIRIISPTLSLNL